MPIYDFTCPRGHTREALRPVGTESVPCGCGSIATRVVVAPVAHQMARRWGSDFHVSREMRGALDEASGYKAEALAAMQEAESNGFRREN